MATAEGPKRPSLKDLRQLIQRKPSRRGGFRLNPTIADAIPVSSAPEDTAAALSEEIARVFDEELKLHTELNPDSKRDISDFVKTTFGYDDRTLARCYMLPVSEVLSSGHLRVRRTKTPRGTGQQAEDAFKGMFVLASVLKRSTNGPEELRIALTNPNNETGVSIDILVRNQEVPRAVGLVLKKERQVADDSGDYLQLPYKRELDL